MNSTIYVFGRFGKGFTQYPDDYARGICQKCCEAVTAQAKLVIYRDKELMYYGYVHPLETPREDPRQCIGFCIVLNGVMLTQSAGLIDLFNDAVASLVDQGELIASGRAGGLRAKVDSLKDSSREVADVVKLIQQGVSKLAGSAKPLPPQNYGLSTIGSQGLYRLTGSIEQAATQSGYACIDAPAAAPAPTHAAAPANGNKIWGWIVGVMMAVGVATIILCNCFDGPTDETWAYDEPTDETWAFDEPTDETWAYDEPNRGGVLAYADETRKTVIGCSPADTFVTIPSSVTAIGNGAFGNCPNLTSVSISSSVTSIGNCTFYNCTSLTSVTIPSSVTLIGWGAFWGCKSLTSIIIPSSVTSIWDWTFRDCTNLTSVIIPSSITSIGRGAFSGCTGLTSVTIPSSVTTIGDWAFDGCANLTSVTILSSAVSIGKDAFPDDTHIHRR